MEIICLSIPELKLIKPKIIEDSRGFFKESYNKIRYQNEGLKTVFVQDNCSFSKKGVLRGMHFSTAAQAKLVSVMQGKIFDVAVDIRPGSPTFGKWEGVVLDADQHEQFFIPEGFAHGFYVMSDEGALVHYKMSSVYNPDVEKTFRFDDPAFSIEWPNKQPILSLRDENAPFFTEGLLV